MDDEQNSREAYNDVLRKIGRNLLLFQQAEHLLKQLITLASISGTRENRTANQENQQEEIANQTLGQVAKRFHSNHCTEVELPAEPPDDLTSIAISLHFSFFRDEAATETRREELTALVAERNNFVHQLYTRVDQDSLESCCKTGSELDQQYAKFLPQVRLLKSELALVRDGFKAIISYLQTPEGLAELTLPDLQQSPLVQQFVKIAGQTTGPDGWTSLREAALKVQDQSRKMIPTHFNDFHQKSLTGLIKASRLFEVKLESNETGGSRTFFRLKPAMESLQPA